MNQIAFFDIEVNINDLKIEKLGIVLDEDKVNSISITPAVDIFEHKKPTFICGHNFIEHDKKFLSETKFNPYLQKTPIIDTLLLSMLLFPNKKTHKLSKPYKTELNIENQPLGDAEQTKELFVILNKKFEQLDERLKSVYVSLLFESDFFSGYFNYKKANKTHIDIYEVVKDRIVCAKEEFLKWERSFPLELAFVISFVFSDKEASISQVILKKFPKVVEIVKSLTFDINSLDLTLFANEEFGIESFNSFDAVQESSLFAGEQPKKISQYEIISNALLNDSILAILPTGGGKTFAFQMPALIKAKAYKGLTVVISPLQALMKNHVDSFKQKNQNFKVVAISGYISSIERMNLLIEVENGVVDILYLAPEALRSNSIFSALKRRVIERFIIDEAHCFSSWGHDFRHDYFFIADTIKELEKESLFQPPIPVSCFTATAKPEVLKDIKKYLKSKLEIEPKEFIASTKRDNLMYRAIEVKNKSDKYGVLVKELIELGRVPTIIYIPQNARECKELSQRLKSEPMLQHLDIEPFYSKIDEEIEKGSREGRGKSEILNDFIENRVDIVVATTAFGMGIDKPDIQAVIHYEQSDSLEAYLQESGRGARKKDIVAQCIVLYSKDDFNKMFLQLNHSKIDYHEIDRIVKELKFMKKEEVYVSPKQLAQKMGIDTEDSKIDYEVMIKTALLELEHAGIVKRGRNSVKIFATSIDKEKRSMEYVHSVLKDKKDSYGAYYEYMILVMQNIIQRSKVDALEADDLADMVGIDKKKIFEVLYALQKEQLLAFNNDISVYIKESIKKEFKDHFELESSVLEYFKGLDEYLSKVNLKDIMVCDTQNLSDIKKIIQSWSHLSKLRSNIFNASFKKHYCYFDIKKEEFAKLEALINIRKATCSFIVEQVTNQLGEKKENEIEISTNRLKSQFDDVQKLSLEGFHHCLVYLHEMLNGFKLRKGRLIYYQTLKLSKQENIKATTPYTKRGHYNKSLKPYYERKIESIHIQIEFLAKLLKDGWEKTMKFVQDYFSMDYVGFKKLYGFNEKEIKLPITKERFAQIVQDLNDEQKRIFEDKTSDSIMVLAGPGSGKTKTLVHKIASLVTIENKKPDYFLMLAHSRVAVAEFKQRLQKLIGSQAHEVKIFTFHGFALELLGRRGQDILDSAIPSATQKIRSGEITLPYMQMLVLDEYQDVGKTTYEFIKAIYEKMSKDKKIIAVGDDDQCINNFGNDRADIAYINEFESDFKDDDEQERLVEGKSNFSKYSLLTNYRSKKNIVALANEFCKELEDRLKTQEILSSTNDNGAITFGLYDNCSYINKIIDEVKEDSSKSIAILARSNDEVLTIYSQLLSHDIKAKYITANDGFKLGDMVELRDFLEFWQKSGYENAKIEFDKRYTISKNYKLASAVIERFWGEYENEIFENELHFQTIFEEYLNEIEFDEFEQSRARVVVSTMHKSKGKEFDSVYLAIGNDFFKDEYDKRLFYVALTRAKLKLSIHSKDSYFSKFNEFYNETSTLKDEPKEPNRIAFMMKLSDIQLSSDYAKSGVERINPKAGEKVLIKERDSGVFEFVKNGYCIATLSKASVGEDRVSKKILDMRKRGYILENEAQIEYVVQWQNRDTKIKYKEVLANIFMSKK